MELDDDGVEMMFPAKTGGTAYRLGDAVPGDDEEHLQLWADTLTPLTENGVKYWQSTGRPVSYASGKKDGTSHRLMIIAGGGAQTYNWQTGAIEHGYCGSPADLNAFEATVYCRLRELTGTHESVGWAIRGGRHDGPNASCIGLSLRNPPSPNSVYKELTWPTYGYSDVRPMFNYTKTSGAWVGIKVVSYILRNSQVRNLMYLDVNPYGVDGRKNNEWRRYLEWIDTQGLGMGPYVQASVWAGWMNMFRVDGWKFMDFSVLSAREIVPPL